MTHEHDDTALDALFAQARNDGPRPDLMARVMADAAAIQAEVPDVAPPPQSSGWLAVLLSGLGGWSAVSGITAAGVMGLSVGLYSPDTISDLLENDSLSWGFGTYDLTPDVGDLWTEDGDV